MINKKTPDRSGFVSLDVWEVPIPRLHGWYWNRSQLKCYPGLGEGSCLSCSFYWEFFNTFNHGVLSKPESMGSQSIMGCTGTLQDSKHSLNVVPSRILSGWFQTWEPWDTRGADLLHLWTVTGSTRGKTSCFWQAPEGRSLVDKQTGSEISNNYLVPCCFRPVLSKWLYFYLNLHLAKVKSQELAEHCCSHLELHLPSYFFLT